MSNARHRTRRAGNRVRDVPAMPKDYAYNATTFAIEESLVYLQALLHYHGDELTKKELAGLRKIITFLGILYRRRVPDAQ